MWWDRLSSAYRQSLTFLRKDVKSFVQGMWCCPWPHLFVLICSFKHVIIFFAPHPPLPFSIDWIYIVIVYVNLSSNFTLLVKMSGVNNVHDSISVSYWKLFCFVPWTFVCLLLVFTKVLKVLGHLCHQDWRLKEKMLEGLAERVSIIGHHLLRSEQMSWMYKKL